jgi:hypothetical protein
LGLFAGEVGHKKLVLRGLNNDSHLGFLYGFARAFRRATTQKHFHQVEVSGVP